MRAFLRKHLTVLFVALVFAVVPLAVSATLSAQGGATGPSIGDHLACGSNFDLDIGDCDEDVATGTSRIQDIITTVVNILSVIVAIVAIIMIIWGGFKYITSGGDSGNITTAKNTIIYAIIGLVIVALAQFLVQFVLSTIGG